MNEFKATGAKMMSTVNPSSTGRSDIST